MIKFVRVDANPPRCDVRRGGERSKVYCELPPGHLHAHLGRGRAGQWFGWT